MKPSRSALLFAMFAPAFGLLMRTTWGLKLAPPQPASGGTRGPSALLFQPDGKRLYIAEQDENDVAVLNPADGQVVAHFATGGTEPRALALSPDGKLLVVVNTFSGTVGLVDSEKGTLRGTVRLPGQPCGVVVAPNGRAFVSVSDLNQVAVIDLATQKVLRRIPVGTRPRALTLTPDGKTLFCANLLGGGVSVIDVAAQAERGRIPVPAINLRDMAVSADGSEVIVTAQQPHNDNPTTDPDAIWSNVLCVLRLKSRTGEPAAKAEAVAPTSAGIVGTAGTTERVLNLDLPDRGAADPCGIALDARGETAFVTLSGTHELAVVPLTNLTADGKLGAIIRRLRVGANPKALALRPQSGELWIGNHLGSTLSVFSNPGGLSAMRAGASEKPASTLRPAALAHAPTIESNPQPPSASPPAGTVRTVELGNATFSPNRKLKGRFLFASAHITRGGHFTCETCHPDGNTDGLSWKFAHVTGGVPVRNTRDLRSEILLTGPYGWDARDEDFEDFVNHEIVGLLHTRKMEHSEVHALWDLINEIVLPPNPYRNADNTYTASALRGKAIFRGAGRCASCHVGEEHGGTKRVANIGTTPPGQTLDVPHLIGAYSSAPYFHDGRAATLEEIFSKHNSAHKHGNAHLLTPAQMKDVLEYVREL